MASLAEKTSTLGYVNAMHLLRRTTHKPTKALANTFANLTPAQALDQLFTYTAPSLAKPVDRNDGTEFFPDFNTPTVTYDATYDTPNGIEIINYWMYNALKSSSIEWKLGMFLHSIYITTYSHLSMTYDHVSLLRMYTNKSLKELAYKMTLNQRMLYYLNNNSNTKYSPNQNYGREFLELFTILKGEQVADGNYTNYTELDVQQASRVLTGFRATYARTARMDYLDKGTASNTAGFAPNPTNAGWTYQATNIPTGYCQLSLHDTGNKTFSSAFGSQTITGSSTLTGSYTVFDELQAFINMVFNQNATAKNYARRLYRFFVKSEITAEVETDIITPLANNLLSTQGGVTYNLEAAVKLLLKSQHFYDEDDSIQRDQNFGGKAKSPIDLMLNFINEADIDIAHPVTNSVHFRNFFNNFRSRCWQSGMQFFYSVDVSGYPGYSDGPNYDRNWVNIATLNRRYYSGWIEMLMNGYTNSAYTTRLDIAEFVRSSGNFTNPALSAVLLDEIFDMFLVSNPQGLRYGYFENALLDGLTPSNWAVTWNAWMADLTSVTKKNAVRIALDRLFKALLKSPEYQVL